MPVFITLEGTEGVGKSTALNFIQDYLNTHYVPFITTREPGGTPLAEKIRYLLLTKDDGCCVTVLPMPVMPIKAVGVVCR